MSPGCWREARKLRSGDMFVSILERLWAHAPAASKYARRALPVGLGLIVSFACQGLLGRMLGPNLFGAYGLLMTWALTTAIMTRAGHELLLMRNLPALIDTGDRSKIRFVIAAAFWGVAKRLIAAVFLLAVVLWLWLQQSPTTIALSVSIAAVAAISGLLRFVSLSQSRTWAAELPESFLRPCLLVAMVFGLNEVGKYTSLTTLLQFTLASALAALFFGTVLLTFTSGLSLFFGQRDPFDLLGGDSLTRSALANSSMQLVFRNADVLAVGTFCSSAETGLYLAATRIAAIPTAVLTTLDPVIGPTISRHAHAGRDDLMRRVTVSYCLVTGAISLVALVMFAAEGARIVTFVFGDAFIDAAPIALILFGGHFISNLGAPVGLSFNLSGRHAANLKINAVAALATAALLFTLTPAFGAFGAGAAFVAASLLKTVMQIVGYRHATRLNDPPHRSKT